MRAEPSTALPAASERRHKLRAATALAIATLGFSIALALRERLDPWRSTALAAVLGAGVGLWALGARARALFTVTARSALVAVALGAVLVATTHGVYRVASVAFPELAISVRALYASIDVGASRLTLVFLTAIVVVGEEIVWRGVAVDLATNAGSRMTIGAISVALYVVPQLVGGVPLLIVAAALLGSLFAAQRLVMGRLTDALLTHVVWSVAVFVVIPLV